MNKYKTKITQYCFKHLEKIKNMNFEPGFEPVLKVNFDLDVWCGHCDKYVNISFSEFDKKIKDYICISCANEIQEIKKEMERYMAQSKKEMEKDMAQSKKEMERYMAQSKKEMEKDMAQSKKEMEKDMAQSKKEMEKDMAQSKKEMEKELNNG